MSLPVGQWSWADRWVCTGDEDMLPFETETHSSKRLNDTKFLSEPANPRQARHPSDVPSSVYNESYSQEELNFKHTSQHDRIAQYMTRKAKQAQQNTERTAKPYDHVTESQNLWVRINPGFHQQPFKTETSEYYVDHTAEAHPLDKTHYLKSMNLPPAAKGPIVKTQKKK